MALEGAGRLRSRESTEGDEMYPYWGHRVGAQMRCTECGELTESAFVFWVSLMRYTHCLCDACAAEHEVLS